MLEFFSQAALLDGEEPESEHAQREMMLPANPGADLVVIEADFALGELEDLLDVVAVGHSAEQRFSVNGRIFGREEVLRLGTVEALNDQQDSYEICQLPTETCFQISALDYYSWPAPTSVRPVKTAQTNSYPCRPNRRSPFAACAKAAEPIKDVPQLLHGRVMRPSPFTGTSTKSSQIPIVSQFPLCCRLQ